MRCLVWGARRTRPRSRRRIAGWRLRGTQTDDGRGDQAAVQTHTLALCASKRHTACSATPIHAAPTTLSWAAAGAPAPLPLTHTCTHTHTRTHTRIHTCSCLCVRVCAYLSAVSDGHACVCACVCTPPPQGACFCPSLALSAPLSLCLSLWRDKDDLCEQRAECTRGHPDQHGRPMQTPQAGPHHRQRPCGPRTGTGAHTRTQTNRQRDTHADTCTYTPTHTHTVLSPPRLLR
jgi:hypothetical protein